MRAELPTVPAGASLEEARHSFLAEAALGGSCPARATYLALLGRGPVTTEVRELLRSRARLPSLKGQWAATAAKALGVETRG